MISSPLVSVIIPTHNRLKFLQKALDCVLNQSYDNLDIIVILDGCVDNSLDFIQRISKKEERIRHITNEKAVGGMQARLQGIQAAKGKYISFLDDDDIWEKEKIELQVNFLEKNTDISIVGCNYSWKTKDRIYPAIDTSGLVSIEDLKYSNNLGSFTFCCVRSEDIKSINFKSNVPSCQDWYTWLSVLIHSGKNAYILKEYLAIYDDGDHIRVTNVKESKIQGYQFLIDEFKDRLTDPQRKNILLESILFQLKYFKFNLVQRIGLFIKGISYLLVSRYSMWNRFKRLLKYTVI